MPVPPVSPKLNLLVFKTIYDYICSKEEEAPASEDQQNREPAKLETVFQSFSSSMSSMWKNWKNSI